MHAFFVTHHAPPCNLVQGTQAADANVALVHFTYGDTGADNKLIHNFHLKNKRRLSPAGVPIRAKRLRAYYLTDFTLTSNWTTTFGGTSGFGWSPNAFSGGRVISQREPDGIWVIASRRPTNWISLTLMAGTD